MPRETQNRTYTSFLSDLAKASLDANELFGRVAQLLNEGQSYLGDIEQVDFVGTLQNATPKHATAAATLFAGIRQIANGKLDERDTATIGELVLQLSRAAK